VFRLQFDEFQIVTSSHDDTILIWDFLNFNAPCDFATSGGTGNQSIETTNNSVTNGAGENPAAPLQVGVDIDDDLNGDDDARLLMNESLTWFYTMHFTTIYFYVNYFTLMGEYRYFEFWTGFHT